ncbi:Flp family type IVb pilin [Arthrobacter sp. SD76]|uniref:Flp family type IVb pilin n=1 Tax=Arthrobacter sp. SD76 TaxID=3415007 RepID=UPI003C744572
MLTHLIPILFRSSQALKTFLNDQRGATATEYGILVSFLAMALVFGVTAFGQALNLHYQGLAASLSAALGIP